jgi:hypothetical protein
MITHTVKHVLVGIFIGVMFFLFPRPSYAIMIYNQDTIESRTVTPDGTTVSSWKGVSDDSSVGCPYVSHITTNDSSFKLEGYIVYGEINIVIQNGSVEIIPLNYDSPSITLNNIGERTVAPYQSYLNFSISPYSSIFFYGGSLNLSLTDPFYSPPGTDSLTNLYYNKYSNIDFKGPDKHINNGTNDAFNFAWNSSWNKSPWLLITTETQDGWVWWHEHPYGVVYIPLSGCIISYCYTEDDDECYETSDGIIRYEELGIVYREIITVKQGFEECIFAVTDFYINEPLGQPIFYPGKTELIPAIKRPLRSYFRL